MDAIEAWQDGQGTDKAFDLLCNVTAAQRRLARYEGKLADLAWLRSQAARLRAAQKRADAKQSAATVVEVAAAVSDPTASESPPASGDLTGDAPADDVLAPAERFVRPGDEPNSGEHGVQRAPWA